MNSPFFSVLMLTYNSSWDKTRQTLYSIIIQKFTDFEIIIADDGSKENNFSKIKEYFSANGFTNYTLVANETNQGIVKSFQSGLVLCKGKYIKPISPGDFLYDEATFSSVHDEINYKEAAVYFGRAAFYSNIDGDLKLYPEKCNPRDLMPYLKNDYKAIKRNYLIHHDYILGASTFYKKYIFERYFSDISKIVKYAEDCTMIYMVANDEKLEYLHITHLIWYEYSSGISTNKDSKWAQRLHIDNEQTFKLLTIKGIIPKWVYEMRYGKNVFKRKLTKILHIPLFVVKRLFPAKNTSSNCNIDILRNILKQ